MLILALIGFIIVIALFGFTFKNFNESLDGEKPIKKHFPLVISFPITAFLLFIYYFASDGNYLYVISKIFCQLCALSFVISAVLNVFRYIRKKSVIKAGSTLTKELGKYFYIIPIITFCCLFVYIFTSPAFQQAINYHHLKREPQGGKYAYYVIAENNKGKEYTLPAEVVISYDESQKISYDPTVFDYEEKTEYTDLFLVQRVYFNNGGYLYFEEPLGFSEPDEKLSETDQDGRSWDITLTDRYIKNKFIDEYNPLTAIDHIFYVCTSFLVIIQWVLWYKAYIKNTNEIFNFSK